MFILLWGNWALKQMSSHWNRILFPKVLEETLYYCDTDHIICLEIEFNIENKDLELAFYRALGPSVRYKLFTKRLITAI